MTGFILISVCFEIQQYISELILKKKKKDYWKQLHHYSFWVRKRKQ